MEELFNIETYHISNIFGALDEHLRKLEKEYDAQIVQRDGGLKIIASEKNAKKVVNVLNALYKLSQKGVTITTQNVDYAIAMNVEEKADAQSSLQDDVICRTILGKSIVPKTLGQKQYVDAIRNNMITFGIGPAGVGKTYLAMALAVKSFKAGEVQRIIMTRPAIEAGEKLGFLPGDLQSKVDPYLRPLYDALYEIMGAESFLANQEKGLIEVAPLAYMRGRTLDNAFIILDEAQNTTKPQMKMFLTRIGFNSKVVVTGDKTQKDLPRDVVSGLDIAQKVLKNIEGISFIELTSKDVVRHPLVAKIVDAYDKYEEKNKDK